MDLIDQLQEILAKRRLTPLFQPVVDLRERCIVGYEALIRGPSDSPLHAPLNLFDAANRAGKLAANNRSSIIGAIAPIILPSL